MKLTEEDIRQAEILTRCVANSAEQICEGDIPLLWEAFHDVIVNVMACKKVGDKTLLNSQSLIAIYNCLPEHIKSIAREWGMNDTVFRDTAYVWLSVNWPDAQYSVK